MHFCKINQIKKDLLLIDEDFYDDPLNEDYSDNATWSWDHETTTLTLYGYRGEIGYPLLCSMRFSRFINI